MKFAKILQSELVPEWRRKYIDYRRLKRLLKSIEQEITQTCESSDTNVPNEVSITIPQPTAATAQQPKRRPTIMSRMSKNFSNKQKEHHLVSYDAFWDQIHPQEKKFFKALEDNLNKVENFYEIKLNEDIKRFEELNAQYKFMKESRVKKKLKENEAWSNRFKQEIEHLSEHLSSSQSCTKIQQDDQTEYRFNQDMDYRTAKRLIRKAVLELYRGIELLKNYKILNQTGFVKILKKYDKVTKRNASEIYLPRIHDCNFIKSPALEKLIKETETFYINNFKGGDRSKAMKNLRLPQEELKLYHFVTWRVGLYIGLSIPILVRAIELAFNVRTSFDQKRWPIVLQIYSMYFIIIVFALLFGINMYAWSRARINYKFIFEFDPRHNLNFRQYLEIPALMLMIFSYMMYIGFVTGVTLTFVWILGVILLSILLCPFNIFYYDARRWLIIALSRIVASGFFYIEFRDFFIADELNSLTYIFTNSQFLFCAIRECSGLTFLTPLLTSLPPWWRFVQCVRRYFDSYNKHPHLVNAGKYFSTIVAVWLLFLFRSNNNYITKSVWVGGQTISTIYTLLWDLLMDWSLLQLNSQNYLLRDELSFKHHSVYYFAIISNGLLRFSWIMLLVIPGEYARATLFAIAFGEMLRRWQWNFYRVENEHINNCGQFRAVKEIPLPFEKEIIHGGSELARASNNNLHQPRSNSTSSSENITEMSS